MKLKTTFSLIVIFFIFLSTSAQLPTPNNYIIFLDFSARIEAKNQKEKDIKLVTHIIDVFKKRVESLYKGGKIFSEDKISILFYPDLNDSQIIELSSSLNVDFSAVGFHDRLDYFKKQFPQSQEPILVKNFNKIYDIALSQKPNYFGSNIYDFFRYSIDSYLKEGFNNKIFLFSDGYMYMAGENPANIGNKIGHLEGSILDPLRANLNWQKLYDSQNWGLISSGITLPPSTTICLLELNPDCINNITQPRTRLKPLKPCPSEYQILTKFWKDWFMDMDVKQENLSINKTENNLNGVKSKINNMIEK
jgi:hypothetical protein